MALMGGLATRVMWGLGLPLLGLSAFLLVWSLAASHINTSLGKFPGPVAVAQQVQNMYQEYERAQQKKAAFYQRQEARNAARVASDPSYKPRVVPYTGQPTFVSQIGTSLFTVLSGFLLASLIAIPIGIAIGLSAGLYAAFNPLIQLFRPVSPLAWLPLVTIVVSAVYVSSDPMFSKSYLVSMITVMLCALWPTIINTAVGVASISRDLQNVSRVLRLGWWTHVRKIVLPASLPMMFTGLRLSLSIAWMVLIAAEMLAQNPGLGKFVWDEFQNGSSQSLSRIMVAVIVIGLIGYMLDQVMLLLQRLISWDKKAVLR
ncbi:nitrate ABC transporter permease [Acidihalobacter ferrooxydans]|uniref:Nitrate ABC transporter permease n=2 Tax=Acidihalobacter ferrooxydans TaxID=1765967 RepID=A0A1P8ULA0_9GAMM|nr:nitrate ABC transporter permease [Acidihalobacter ferrooxydans]